MSYVAGHWSSWVYGLTIRIGYEVCDWEVEFLKRSDMWGRQVKSGMKQDGCQVGFLRYAAMWGWPKSGMKLCGCCMKILQAESGIWDTWLTGGNTAMGAGKSIRYDAEGLASGLLGVWLCGLISRHM